MADIMTQEEMNKFIDEKLKELQPPENHYGYWQLCPKCDGERRIINEDAGLTDPLERTCPLCKGEGALVRPEIKNDQP